MKKICAFLLSVGLMAAAVQAADQATSVNAVGFEKFNVSTGQLALVRCDFLTMGASLTVSNVFGATLPIGAQLYFWNGTNYQIETYSRYFVSPPANYATNWAPGTNLLVTGKAFWIRLPAVAPQSSYDVTVSGEVPGSTRQPSNTVSVLPGLNMVGYSYPTTIAWTNTTLAKQAEIGDRLYVWDGSSYSIYNYARVFVSPPANYATNWGGGQSVVLNPGQGFWYSRGVSASPISWTEILPYVMP